MEERPEDVILRGLGPGWEVKEMEDHFVVSRKEAGSTEEDASLKSKIKHLQARSAGDHKGYVPLRRLYQLLTVERIETALSEAACINKWHLSDTARKISTEGRRLFSVLVLIDQVASARSLSSSGDLKDHLLPFQRADIERHIPSEEGIKDFMVTQYELLAPEISLGTLLQETYYQAALPFTQNEPIKNAHGNSGTIYEIAINPDHQYLEKPFFRRLVRKEILQSKENEVELENLAILNHLQHPNVAKLLACYSYQHKINLIFPLAEQGTLGDLLKGARDSYPAFTADHAILLALAGLSSALESVHNYAAQKIDLNLTGLHHDFRTKNVLISESTFQLADFGLSRFKDLSEPSDTTWKDTLGFYIAPECMDLITFEKPRIGRKSEIWAFGCMLADVATWMLLGPSGITHFTSQREFQAREKTYMATFHCGVRKENPAVGIWINKLRSMIPRPWQPLIDLVEKMLSIDERCRPETKQVTIQLRLITMSTILRDIEFLFANIMQRDRSLDLQIEMWRLTSWKTVTGVSDSDTWNTATCNFTSSRQTFDIIIRHLQDLLSMLDQIQRDDKISLGSFSSISNTINSLSDSLDMQHRAKMDSTFRNLVLRQEGLECPISLQNLASCDGLDKELRLQLSLKFMTQQDATQASLGDESQRIDDRSIHHQDDHGQLALGEISSNGNMSKVLIEWRQYGEHAADEGINQKLFERVRSVSYIMGFEKSTRLRLLTCRGYFHAVQKFAFGIVYDYPQPAATAPDWEMANLQQILKTCQAKEFQPPLEHRYRLALLLARAIFEFHMVSWLHKNINSFNIVFFSDPKTPHGKRVAEPYLIGFHHCRPDEPSAFSEGISKTMNEDYQHPDYLADRSRRYILQYDYYSLGLVLLEVGLWRPLSSLVSSKKTTAEKNEKLHGQLIPLLSKSMGSNYLEAVKACLSGDLDQQNFDTKVLDRLDGISLS